MRGWGVAGEAGCVAGGLLVMLVVAGGGCAQPAAAEGVGPRLVHLDGRPVVLDAPLGLRAGQPLYVLDPGGDGALADRLPVAVVAAAAPDGAGRWTVVPLCVADRAGRGDGASGRGSAAAMGAGGVAGAAGSGASQAGRAPSSFEPPRADALRGAARATPTGLPATAPVAAVAPESAARLGRCQARARGMPPAEWHPHRSRATLMLDVGAADRARPGDAYAVFGPALADHRTGRIAGFALRAVCRVAAVGHLTAECAVDRSAWPDYGLADWQSGGPAHPVDAPAVGDLARLGGRL